MKVLLDHVKAAINGCRQEKVGLTNRGKSLVGPMYPLVAQQLQWQGQGHATNATGGRGHGSGGGGKGELRPPCSPFGSGGRNGYHHRAYRGKHGPGGTNSNRDGRSGNGLKENAPPAESGRSGRPGCQVQRKRKVVCLRTVERGLWPRPVLATCGQGRPESPDLLICFIIFRASPLGRVALTCPWAHRGQAPASSSFGCALCVENWGMDFPPEI